MLQKFYDRTFVFLKLVEQEYASGPRVVQSGNHFISFLLLYYLIRFKIKSDRDFSLYHFRTAYRLYLEKLLQVVQLSSIGSTYINYERLLWIYFKDIGVAYNQRFYI